MSNKTVSVVMATYNGAKYIREQLDSILEQTYQIQEIIIQDDGSTDDTVAICEEYARKYPNVHVFRNPKNLGFNENFHTCALRATGDLVAFSDQDDVWFPEKIATQVAAIGNRAICCSTHTRGEKQNGAYVVDPQYSLESLVFRSTIAGHSMLCRRDFIQLPECWCLDVIYDWNVAICAHFHGGIIKIDKPLNWHRTNLQSACYEMLRKNKVDFTQRPTYQPYLYGIRNYRHLQQKAKWKLVHQFICDHTVGMPQLQTAHTMAQLMLKTDILSLGRLCMLCLKHGDRIYPNKGRHGLMGKIRQLCYPLIFAYNNTYYE